MPELWKIFNERQMISQEDYVSYIVELLSEDIGLKDKLIVIHARRNNGVYSRELIDFEHNGISFSERAVTQDIKRLKDLGLICIVERVGKVIRYTTTPLGAEVVNEYKKMIKG